MQLCNLVKDGIMGKRYHRREEVLSEGGKALSEGKEVCQTEEELYKRVKEVLPERGRGTIGGGRGGGEAPSEEEEVLSEGEGEALSEGGG